MRHRIELIRKWIDGDYAVEINRETFKVSVRASVGVAAWRPGDTVAQLIARADGGAAWRRESPTRRNGEWRSGIPSRPEEIGRPEEPSCAHGKVSEQLPRDKSAQSVRQCSWTKIRTVSCSIPGIRAICFCAGDECITLKHKDRPDHHSIVSVALLLRPLLNIPCVILYFCSSRRPSPYSAPQCCFPRSFEQSGFRPAPTVCAERSARPSGSAFWIMLLPVILVFPFRCERLV